MIVWQWAGYNTIIYLAGLQAIPTEQYEAAKVDGAGPFRTFFSITLPQLRPVVLFTVIMSTIGGLQTFTEPQVMVGNNGGTGQSGMTVVMYFYNQAFFNNDYGYAGCDCPEHLHARAAVHRDQLEAARRKGRAMKRSAGAGSACTSRWRSPGCCACSRSTGRW